MKLVLHFRNGVMRAVHHDALACLMPEGSALPGRAGKIRRASHVEPRILNNTFDWVADMSPVNGPKLTGFKTRKAALAAEAQYLETNVL